MAIKFTETYAKVVDEVQGVVDRLQSEGHTVATRLENALKSLVAELKHDEAAVAKDAEPAVVAAEGEAKTVVDTAVTVAEGDVAKAVASAAVKK